MNYETAATARLLSPSAVPPIISIDIILATSLPGTLIDFTVRHPMINRKHEVRVLLFFFLCPRPLRLTSWIQFFFAQFIISTFFFFLFNYNMCGGWQLDESFDLVIQKHQQTILECTMNVCKFTFEQKMFCITCGFVPPVVLYPSSKREHGHTSLTLPYRVLQL